MFDVGLGIGYFKEKVLHLLVSMIMIIGVFAVQSMLASGAPSGSSEYHSAGSAYL